MDNSNGGNGRTLFVMVVGALAAWGLKKLWDMPLPSSTIHADVPPAIEPQGQRSQVPEATPQENNGGGGADGNRASSDRDAQIAKAVAELLAVKSPVSAPSSSHLPPMDFPLSQVIPHPSATVILGHRGSGKSGLAVRLQELRRDAVCHRFASKGRAPAAALVRAGKRPAGGAGQCDDLFPGIVSHVSRQVVSVSTRPRNRRSCEPLQASPAKSHFRRPKCGPYR